MTAADGFQCVYFLAMVGDSGATAMRIVMTPEEASILQELATELNRHAEFPWSPRLLVRPWRSSDEETPCTR